MPMDKINPITSSVFRNTMSDSMLANSIIGMGNLVCSFFDVCRQKLLSLIDGCSSSDVYGSGFIVKVLSMMIRTHTDLNAPLTLTYSPHGDNDPDITSNNLITWNDKFFVLAIKDLNPSLSWLDIITEIEHNNFLIKDRRGLGLGYSAGYFPVETIYRHWSNCEAQMSLVQHTLQTVDIFCFADYPHRLVCIDLLNIPTQSNYKDMNNWRSIELVDLLIYLAERGLHDKVQECLKFPSQNCPDLLALSLIQSNKLFNMIRQGMISRLTPIFLESHSNSTIILHDTWNHQNTRFRYILVQAISEWYVISDHDNFNLSRILDMAQDLNALSMLLSIQKFPFVIDLAFLASQRKYLKLEKWLLDEICEYGEEFITVCVQFLEKRCPQLVDLSAEDEHISKYVPLTPQTVLTILDCSQNFSGTISQDNLASIMQMVKSYTKICLFKVVPEWLKLETPQYHRPIEGPIGNILHTTVQDTNRESNSSAQSGFTFTLPVDYNSYIDSYMPVSVPKDIEDEADSYFQRIHNLAPHESIEIDEVLEILKRLKESTVTYERKVFCCILRNLFEEYKFLPAYPANELKTTAHLFGGIIKYGLVSNKLLGLALRFVLNALEKTPDSKMYVFGITALDCFKCCLKHHREYCSYISVIPHFRKFPQHLIEFVEFGRNLQEPPPFPLIAGESSVTSTHGSFKLQYIIPATKTSTVLSTSSEVVVTNAVLVFMPSIANATKNDPLPASSTKPSEKNIVPTQNVQDKIVFIFNNLSEANLQTKCNEIRDIITSEYLPWLSQYLVMKRVRIESNLHTLYSNVLYCLNNEALNSLIILETFRNINILLRSNKKMADFSNRSLLKNLGHWLGMMTLAKNKPILLDDIDLKILLIEAYNKGHQELLFAVPFIAKVLESCAKSKVFKPRNPWTMSIMNCLGELHQDPDLKLTLKFEIEVLCKTLSLELEDLNPGYVLKNSEMAKKLE